MGKKPSTYHHLLCRSCRRHLSQAYGRMGSPPDARDYRAQGGNPCLEQTLESFELCCLVSTAIFYHAPLVPLFIQCPSLPYIQVETFPDKHDSLEDFLETLQMAFLYAKTVTLGPSHWPRTNTVMLRNRRIGCSMSGLAQVGRYTWEKGLSIWILICVVFPFTPCSSSSWLIVGCMN